MSEWIVNCDWGTTQFRLRAVALPAFDVAAEVRSPDGVGSLAARHAASDRPEAYREVLAGALAQLTARIGAALRDAPVLISGMASSSIGWQELDYARLPLALDGSDLPVCELAPMASELGAHRVILISGARSQTDVMRGEETEVLGLFSVPAIHELAAGSLVIKPGTHSKHLGVQDGRIVGLQTFMTGELFDVLSRHSILRHSLAEAESEPLSPDDAQRAVCAGVRHGAATPLSAALFRVRTRELLAEQPASDNREFLSGVLLGGELAYLTEPRWAHTPLVLCAAGALAPHYRAALDELRLSDRLTAVAPADVELLSARGQAAIWRHRCPPDSSPW